MVVIKSLKFDKDNISNARHLKYGEKWPVVYIINNETEAYIGETTNFRMRSNQHLANEIRSKLTTINMISDETFNKSSVLDLESFLIKYMAADNSFKLQNGNAGLQNHNYYQRDMYESKFREVWNGLLQRGLVKNDLRKIENSDIFKYSPYKALTEDQYMIVHDVLDELYKDIRLNKPATFMVNGGPGTGKTILGIYLMKLLADHKIEQYDFEGNELVVDSLITSAFREMKIGLVVPMDNLRTTLKKVFKEIKGLSNTMVYSPHEIGNSDQHFDLLIVDEAHRLRQRKNLTQYATFDKNNKKLGLGNIGTELDWIRMKSTNQIFFYDENQSIKPTDVPKSKFDQLMLESNFHPFYLETQLRCLLGGNEYIRYIKSLFSNHRPEEKVSFNKYEFKMFENVNEMVEHIKVKNNEVGLSRNIAGYSWKWSTKNVFKKGANASRIEESISKGIYDIEIDGHKYIWNTTAKDWINSPNSINEIGSIHTTQGYDLNYTGLIIGNEVIYNCSENRIEIDRSQYFDVKGKNSTNDEQLLKYILNIYTTMMTRGCLGTYIYVCNKELREYLKKFVDVYK